MIICRSTLLRIETVSDKFVEEIRTNILCSKTIYENRAVYEVTWKTMVKPVRTQMKT
jgi:hypothetical protein